MQKVLAASKFFAYSLAMQDEIHIITEGKHAGKACQIIEFQGQLVLVAFQDGDEDWVNYDFLSEQ